MAAHRFFLPVFVCVGVMRFQDTTHQDYLFFTSSNVLPVRSTLNVLTFLEILVENKLFVILLVV